MKTNLAARRVAGVTDKIGPQGLSPRVDASIEGLISTRISEKHNGGNNAFKTHVDKVSNRNKEAENQLMKLGNMLDEVQKGRFRD